MRYYKIVYVLIAFLFTGCATTNSPVQPGGFIYYGIDFRDYSNDDFLITPEEPIGEYNSMGIIRVELLPEIKEITKQLYDGINSSTLVMDNKEYRVWREMSGSSFKYYATEIIDTDAAINEIYRTAKGWGADAIVNFQINREADGISVSGFAINRN